MTKATGQAAGQAAKTATDKATDPGSGLTGALTRLAGVVLGRASSSVTDKVSASTQRLTDYAEGHGGGLATALTGARKLAEGQNPASALLSTGASRVGDTVKKAFGGSGGDDSGSQSTKGGGLKLTNIVESIDVGVPVELAYDQWTRFADFPSFMKKVEQVEQESDERLTWRAQVLWSHRSWTSTILDQVPDERIVWRSEGEKGYVDGAVTFHELAPNLTRILLVLEYHPQGFFEQTGNLWRAQGRRVRLELKHFRRHVMTESLLRPDEIEGWLGTIRDGEVVDEGEDRADDDTDTDEDTDDGTGDRADGDEDDRADDRSEADDDGEDETPDDEAPDDERSRPSRRRVRTRAGR